MTLALQEVFLSDPTSGVPGLLVYDQPSQVYFPKRNTNSKNDEEEEEEKSWRNEDIEAVRKVFALLAAEVLSANRSEEHTSELQSLMLILYAVFCLQKYSEYPTNCLIPINR